MSFFCRFILASWSVVLAGACFPVVSFGAIMPLEGAVGSTHALIFTGTAPAVTQALPAVSLIINAPGQTIDLRNYFGVPGVTGQVVQFNTILGNVNVELLAGAAPKTVTNFLGYVNRGNYINTLFHRLVAGFVLQGGGYTSTIPAVAIPTVAAVVNEYNLPNISGTLAMAKLGGDPNSATSQWFFNLADNTDSLGTTNNGGFTVFGRVIGNGMAVISSIAALPAIDASNPTTGEGAEFGSVPLYNYTPGSSLQKSNLVTINSIKPIGIYSGDSANGSVLKFNVAVSNSFIATATLTGTVLTIVPLASGTTDITVKAIDTSNLSVTGVIHVTVAPTGPAFTQQPVSQTITPGGNVVFTANAPGASGYQWFKGGVAISGATSASFSFANAASTDSGLYTVVASDGNGQTTSAAATLLIDVPNPGRLVNLSVRTNAGTGDQTLIAGFVVSGGGSKSLLIRGVGPTLGAAPYNVPGVLATPLLTVYKMADTSSTVVAADTSGWGGTSTLSTAFQQVGAFSLPATSLDAALLIPLNAGNYTAQITGTVGSTGVALAELYDTEASTGTVATRLINVSARTQVGTGANILITGFFISGNVPKTVLIRATGPALIQYGVGGTLADPKLQLYGNSGLIASNDNWSDAPNDSVQIAATSMNVGAFGLTAGSKDAVLLMTLAPGGYTAQVSGADGGSGVALVEVYEVP